CTTAPNFDRPDPASRLAVPPADWRKLLLPSLRTRTGGSPSLAAGASKWTWLRRSARSGDLGAILTKEIVAPSMSTAARPSIVNRLRCHHDRLAGGAAARPFSISR